MPSRRRASREPHDEQILTTWPLYLLRCARKFDPRAHYSGRPGRQLGLARGELQKMRRKDKRCRAPRHARHAWRFSSNGRCWVESSQEADDTGCDTSCRRKLSAHGNWSADRTQVSRFRRSRDRSISSACMAVTTATSWREFIFLLLLGCSRMTRSWGATDRDVLPMRQPPPTHA